MNTLFKTTMSMDESCMSDICIISETNTDNDTRIDNDTNINNDTNDNLPLINIARDNCKCFEETRQTQIDLLKKRTRKTIIETILDYSLNGKYSMMYNDNIIREECKYLHKNEKDFNLRLNENDISQIRDYLKFFFTCEKFTVTDKLIYTSKGTYIDWSENTDKMTISAYEQKDKTD